MFWMLKPLVKWPDHEQLYQTMPREFRKHFSKCVVVIDCFEVFMERPKGLMHGKSSNMVQLQTP